MANTTSIKKNFVLNTINTVSGLLFPLITFPYASRILLADGIGQVQFLNSIIDYITLLTSLGIPLYAIREIAKVKEDKSMMSKTTMEILLLHTALSFIGYIILFILICAVTKIQADIPLFILLSSSILLNAIGVNWFYSGIEDFKYITIRNIIVKVFSAICLFIFVKEKGDLYYYAAISIAESVGSNIFNFFRLRKYITIMNIAGLNISKHIKPASKIFALNLVISLYIHLDAVMLGFMKDNDAVGYYTTSTKISKILVGIASSLGTVLLPRLSTLVSKNDMSVFTTLSDKCIHFIIALSLPVSIGIIFMASPLIHLFSGDHYEPSILTLQILSPIILLIPLSGIYDMQILYAMGKEKRSILSVSFGAVVNFILNLCLIPLYSQYGAGFATLTAEICVTLSAIFLGRKYVPFRVFSREKIHYYTGSLFIIISLFLLKRFEFDEITYLIVGVITSIMIYFIYLTLVKDSMLTEVKTMIRNKINRR
jgi:O-antigen/teichoic acid export membrane protein